MRPSCIVLAAGVAATFTFALPRAGLAQDELMRELAGIEQSLWEGWAAADATPFERHLTVDHVNIGDWGIVFGRQAVVDVVNAGVCDVTRFELDDWQMVRLSAETALLTFEAEQEAVCGGTRNAAEVVASSVYVLRDGSWKNAAYHETQIVDDDHDDDEDREHDEDLEHETHQDRDQDDPGR